MPENASSTPIGLSVSHRSRPFDGIIALHTSVTRWVEDALLLPGVQLLPFTPQIAIDSVDLPDPMHKDPADRILVATARIERLSLVTRDRDILAFAKATKLTLSALIRTN